MSDILKAQTSDMELLTIDSIATRQDTINDLRFMSYMVPAEDVEEMLGIIALGVEKL